MIFIDERKIKTLLAGTQVSLETLLARIQDAASAGSKEAICSLWFDEAGIRCTYCSEGLFDGIGPQSCKEISQEAEHERIEFFALLRQEVADKLSLVQEAPQHVNIPLYFEREGQVTEPDGLLDMLQEASLRKCWYKSQWGCCESCAEVYFQSAGTRGSRESICLQRSKTQLQALKNELETWLTGN